MQINKFLRKTTVGYIHFCPACSEAHSYRTDGQGGANWSFNGNIEKPSFTPSMKISWGRHADPNYKTEPGDEDLSGICHYFLTDGKIAYCGDSTHAMAGQTIDLPELPEHMQGDRYGDGNP